jgi:hypothetical protein
VNLAIAGIGIWMRGARNWDEFASRIAAKNDQWGGEWSAPAPAQIPDRERRRAPLTVRLAVEVAHQACDMAGIDKKDVMTVFTSSMGDTKITDYMCTTLAGPEKVLSPTRFHNSVHNAPAGYWSISTENRTPSSSVAGSRESFPTALLEASVLCAVESRSVLLVAIDDEIRSPLSSVYPISNPFGAALVLQRRSADSDFRPLSIEHQSGRVDWPSLPQSQIQSLYEGNPAARCLALLECLVRSESTITEWPLSESTHLKVVAEVGASKP